MIKDIPLIMMKEIGYEYPNGTMALKNINLIIENFSNPLNPHNFDHSFNLTDISIIEKCFNNSLW